MVFKTRNSLRILNEKFHEKLCINLKCIENQNIQFLIKKNLKLKIKQPDVEILHHFLLSK